MSPLKIAFLTTFIDLLGFGIIIPIHPKLIPRQVLGACSLGSGGVAAFEPAFCTAAFTTATLGTHGAA